MRDALQRATRSTDALSERERTVVAELPFAVSTKDLAARLHVSPNTVKTQLRSIYRKLGVSSWADAVSTARRLGLAE
ncbi:MAG TPA: LuxR C-terminal-related transcriptional regulator [Candidatus Microbacterium stercoravium]|uniref:LuxR C-terminal-related transcriptional regulator n=1 Tax=Candidatus Microbacterium stercoravium TaxID=2838697 RepID=A0A9D2KIT6_9MICO|nr:LuxR C-terminal-related transcriptional regulator [Candidatus Microbacterium stercoravium]